MSCITLMSLAVSFYCLCEVSLPTAPGKEPNKADNSLQSLLNCTEKNKGLHHMWRHLLANLYVHRMLVLCLFFQSEQIYAQILMWKTNWEKKDVPPAGWALNELFRSTCCVFCWPILLNGIFYGMHQRRLQMQDSLGIPAFCIASLCAWETKLKMLELISLLVSP